MGTLVPVSGSDSSRRREYNHFAFVPHRLPVDVPLSMSTYKILGEADRSLGALDARINQLPNPALLIRPSLTREAVSTSALEGTFAPLSDVLEARYVDDIKKSAEVREISNYIDAALRGLELIKTLPVCLRMLAELQQILVKKTRGDSYDAGELRDRLVCIGDRGQGIEESRFVPPPPGETLRSGVSDWEKWINADDDVPLLVKAALGHYQFETLHPFSDGNGRIGRLAVTLQLIDAGALAYPLLNLSPWFEPRRQEYVDHLLFLSQTGNYDPWVRFFGEAIKDRSESAGATVNQLVAFREETAVLLKAHRAKGVIMDVANDLTGFPVMTVGEIAANHNITYQAANSIVARLETLGIIREATGKSYGRLFICDRVYGILFDN
jgi:Fic family protein